MTDTAPKRATPPQETAEGRESAELPADGPEPARDGADAAGGRLSPLSAVRARLVTERETADAAARAAHRTDTSLVQSGIAAGLDIAIAAVDAVTPAPPAGALRDTIAEAVYEYNNPGFRWADAHPHDRAAYTADARAALPVVCAELDRRATLHADTERRLRDDLRAEVQQREAAEQQLAAVRGLADDLRGVTGARYIADALDKILAPKETTVPICNATITTDHGPDGNTVYCTRDAGHTTHHTGPATDGHGQVHWIDHHAGATPHNPELRYSTEPPLDDIPSGGGPDIQPL